MRWPEDGHCCILPFQFIVQSPNMKPISRPTSRSASRTTTPRLRKQDPSTPMHIEEEAALGDVETSRERRNSGDREEVDEFDEEMDTTTREENVELDTAKQKVLQSFRADLGVIMDKVRHKQSLFRSILSHRVSNCGK